LFFCFLLGTPTFGGSFFPLISCLNRFVLPPPELCSSGQCPTELLLTFFVLVHIPPLWFFAFFLLRFFPPFPVRFLHPGPAPPPLRVPRGCWFFFCPLVLLNPPCGSCYSVLSTSFSGPLRPLNPPSSSHPSSEPDRFSRAPAPPESPSPINESTFFYCLQSDCLFKKPHNVHPTRVGQPCS